MVLNNKVLIVLPNDTLGGAEQYLKMVAQHFKNDYKSEIYVVLFKKAYTNAWEPVADKIFYGSTNRERYGIFDVFRSFLKLRKTKFNYVFTSHIHTNSLVGIFRKIKLFNSDNFVGRESTSTFARYDGLKLKIFKLQYLAGYSALDLLICQSDYMKGQLITALPWLEKKVNVKVLGNPINLNLINENHNIEIFDFPFIIAAGRLIHEKGYDILIDAFFKIKDEFPEHKLVILGEGHLREKLEKQVVTLNIVDRVIMPGFVDNVYTYFNHSKACVVSSRIEGFPNVLLQMMSQNNNIVSTLCAGGIENIKGLYTVETNNVIDLSYSIKKCLLNNNIDNRKYFNEELSTRSIDSFVKKINSYLN